MRSLRRLALIPLAVLVAACGSTVHVGQQEQTAVGQGSLGLDGLTSAPTASSAPTEPVVSSVGEDSASPDPSAAPSISGATSAPTKGVSHSGPRGTGIGVTSSTITIGIVTAQAFASVAAATGLAVQTGNQQAKAKAALSVINAHGGVAGRKLVPIFYDVNITRLLANKAAEEEAICAKFTQDNKVYAVASPIGFSDDVIYTCLTKAGVATASAGESFDAQLYRQFPSSFYMPGDMNMTRILSTNIDALYDAGYFTGWDVGAGKPGKAPVKVGLIRSDSASDGRVSSEGVKPALTRHGLKLTAEYAIPPSLNTNSAYQSAVLQFKAAGVTHVLWTGTGGAGFADAAHNQAYHPRIGFNSRNSPGALLEDNDPRDELVGSMGIGWQQYNDVSAANDPGAPSPWGKECLSAIAKAGEDNSIRASALISAWYCDTLYFLAQATSKAPTFALAGLRAGAESLGTFGAASTFRSTYRPSRLHDGASAYRLVKFVDACSCYRYTTPLRTIS